MKNLRAALTLFTRIPVWKLGEIPSSAYDSAVVFWPFAGWITGGVMALAIYWLSFVMPPLPAVAIALILRLLITGGLHEDGLADFFDGFGGGRDKEAILSIMKDCHIGSYGVLSLITYFILIWSILSSMPPYLAAFSIFAADPFAKFCASQIINLLPYSRPEGAKNKISYAPMNAGFFLINLIAGIAPFIPLAFISTVSVCSIVFPLFVLTLLITYMKNKIGGYTGDCCGATFLICEVSLLIGILIFNYIQ